MMNEHVGGTCCAENVGLRGRESGFALVTSLLILAVVTTLGVGAFFVSNLSLRIAENTRSATVAQFNAYEGLDVSLLAVARFFRSNFGTYPDDDQLEERMPSDRASRYEATIDPTVGSDGGVVVTVVGFGPRGARYETGARIVGVLSPINVPDGVDESFGRGWVTLADININGFSIFTIPLWAAGKVDANSTRVIGGDTVYAWSGEGHKCRIRTNNSDVECVSNDPPEIPVFNFADRRDLLWAQRGDDCDAEITESGNLVAGLYIDQTVCLETGVSVTLTGTAKGLYIIGKDETSTLVLDGGSAPSGDDRVGLKAAVATIRTGTSAGRGNTTAYDLTGVNTLFAVNTIEWVNVGSAVTSPGVISTVIATEGSLLFSGNLKGTLNAVLWTNGHVCKSGAGGLDFNGSIQARGEGDVPSSQCDPGIYWNGGGGGSFTDIDNEDLENGGDDDDEVRFAAAGIRVLSMRP